MLRYIPAILSGHNHKVLIPGHCPGYIFSHHAEGAMEQKLRHILSSL